MIQKIKDAWWAVLYALALKKFHRNCNRMSSAPPEEAREWIAKNRWDIKDMTEGIEGCLAEIIEKELKWLEWSMET